MVILSKLILVYREDLPYSQYTLIFGSVDVSADSS